MKPKAASWWQPIPEDEPLDDLPDNGLLGELGLEDDEAEDARAERHLRLLHEQLRQVELEEEHERAAAVAAAEAAAAEASEAEAGPAGATGWRWLLTWLQPLATLNASAATCLALLAAGVAVGAWGFFWLLLMLRSFGPPAALEVPLHFDYSTPTATALAQVVEHLPSTPASVLMDGLASSGIGAAGIGLGGVAAAGLGAATPWSLGTAGRSSFEAKGKDGATAGTTPGAGATTGTTAGAVSATPGATAATPPTVRRPTGSEQVYRWSGKLDVEVRLEMPQYGELFQVTGELLGASGRPIARSTTTYLPRGRHWMWQLTRHMMLAPCYAVGYCTDLLTVRLPLFRGQTVSPPPGDPVTHFRATLASRAAAAGLMAPPAVHKARVQLSHRTGLLKRVLLWLLRPSLPLSLFLGSAALMIAFGSGLACLACGGAAVVLYYVSLQLAGRAPADEAVAKTPSEPVMETEVEEEEEEMFQEPG